MHHSCRVRSRQRLGKLDTGFEQHGGRNGPALDLGAKRLPADVLVDQAEPPVDLLEGKDRGNARVRQRRRGSRLEPHALQAPLVARVLGRQQLDGHVPTEAGVLGQVHDPHAATVDLPLDAVPPEDLPFRQAVDLAGGQAARHGSRHLQEPCCPLVRLQERRHFGAQSAVAAASLVEKRGARAGLSLDRGVEDRGDAIEVSHQRPVSSR